MTGLTMASVKFLFLSTLGLYWGIASPLVLAQSAPSPQQRVSQPVLNSSTPVAPSALSTEPAPNPLVMPSGGLSPETGNPVIPSTAYRLAVGDRIFIRVINVPEYSAEYQVQPDGTIGLPVVGGVSVWGMTVQQVAQEVTQHYTESDVLRNPSISVTLLAASSLRIVVAGEVNRPGAYTLGVTDGKLPTVTQAIQQAGGMTQQADLRQVQIIRPQRSGKDEKLQVNLWEMLRNGDARQDVLLHDGDSIVLATAAAVDPAEAHLLGNANLSPEAIQVGIVGEVRQAGTLQVPPNTPLNQAILTAGGFNHRARSSVMLIRLNPNGTVTQRQIHVDFSANANETTNPILHNRDVIVVRRSSLAAIGDALGTILGPIGQGFSLFGLFNSLFPKSSP